MVSTEISNLNIIILNSHIFVEIECLVHKAGVLHNSWRKSYSVQRRLLSATNYLTAAVEVQHLDAVSVIRNSYFMFNYIMLEDIKLQK